MAKILVLGFKSTSGGSISLSVNRPAETVTPAQIKSAMETIIEQETIGARIEQANGSKRYETVAEIAYAKYVTTEDTSFDFED